MKHFAVIGYPINHSRSPQLHNAAFHALEMDDCHFESVEVKPEDLGDWVKNHFRKFYKGAAITVPHKVDILKYIDVPTDSAIKIGAVNTLYWQEDRLVGTNTDGVGALKAIETGMNSVEDKKALILGAGGASRSIIFALKFAGMQVAIWNRTTEKAQQLADEFEVGHVEELSEEAFDLFDLVVNATSVGLKEWKSVIPENFWSPHQVAFDIVYEPLETKFLSDALDAGCEIITGDKMLVHQAIEQFKIWHDCHLEPEIMEQAFFTESPTSLSFDTHPSGEAD